LYQRFRKCEPEGYTIIMNRIDVLKKEVNLFKINRDYQSEPCARRFFFPVRQRLVFSVFFWKESMRKRFFIAVLSWIEKIYAGSDRKHASCVVDCCLYIKEAL